MQGDDHRIAHRGRPSLEAAGSVRSPLWESGAGSTHYTLRGAFGGGGILPPPVGLGGSPSGRPRAVLARSSSHVCGPPLMPNWFNLASRSLVVFTVISFSFSK